MGNTDSKASFKKAMLDLRSKDKVIEAEDDQFWQQFWKDQTINMPDVFALVSPSDIRTLREDSPQNFATLTFKCIDQIRKCTESSCATPAEQQNVLNCVRLLTRLIPFFLEEPEWRSFFWSQLPSVARLKSGPLARFSTSSIDEEASSNDMKKMLAGPVLATTLMDSLSALLFCPSFTVTQHKKNTEEAEDLTALDCCEYIWAAGVGFALPPTQNAQHDTARIDILKLVLSCFSETVYNPQAGEGLVCPNRWLEHFMSAENRQVLPLFTSLLNTVFSYDPVGYGVPYNYLMFGDPKEALAETALQVLVVCLDHIWSKGREKLSDVDNETGIMSNMFINYLSRIHREEDLTFMINGFVRLLNNPLQQGYLPSSTKKIQFHQELLALFWKCCEYNKRFLYHVLKSCVVLDIVIPILYALNECRQNPGKIGLVHLGIFILLMLSGERNFGVRLNKPYTNRLLPELPPFTGNHADLLVLVFYRLMTAGHAKLQPLFDCLLTIILNVSAYVKSFAMISATKLLHLFEAFSTPWFLYANSTNHHLIFFLLETFNNIVQYQFDGNCPLVYCIIRKRALFHQLVNLPMDHAFIDKTISAKKTRKLSSSKAVMSSDPVEPPLTDKEGASTSSEPELHASLPQAPGVSRMTGKTTVMNSEGFYDGVTELPSVSGVIAEDAFEASCSSQVSKSASMTFSPTTSAVPAKMSRISMATRERQVSRSISVASSSTDASRPWTPTPEWVQSWRQKLPMTTLMRLLQVLVPQVEKICMDKNITDENDILKFLQRGTLVGLLPVPHPIMVRKYASNSGTNHWIRSYIWGIICLRMMNPPIWLDTKVVLFELQSC